MARTIGSGRTTVSAAISAVQASTTRTVTNTNDSGPGSLRQAIQDAAAGDTITFRVTVTGPITLTSGELGITKAITIAAPPGASQVIDGNNADRVIEAGAATSNSPITAYVAVTLINVTIQHGRYYRDGGGIKVDSGNELTLLDSVVIDNSAGYSAGGISNAGTLTVRHSVLSGNNGFQLGGGILNGGTTTIADSTLSDNHAVYYGGAIDNSGTLMISGSTLSHNFTSLTGGALENDHGGQATIIGSTLSDNSISDSFSGGLGGAIFSNGQLEVRASTLSGNNTPGGLGGAIFNSSAGDVTIEGSTLSGNNANPSGMGGGLYNYFGVAHLGATILAGNVAASSPDCSGDLGSQGYNLIEDPSGCTGQTGADLTGATATEAPGVGSPTIDAVPMTTTLCSATDQRGYGRPDDEEGACDIGAVETGAALLVTTADDPSACPLPSAGLPALSLRCAIAAAQPGDRIAFGAAVTGPITLLQGELDVTKTLTIGGPTGATQPIDGRGASRVFEIGATDANGTVTASTAVTLTHVTIQNGNAAGSQGVDSGNGGAILVDQASALTLANSTLTANTATTGGGVYARGPTTLIADTLVADTASVAGAVDAQEPVTLTADTLTGNTATLHGGGVESDGGSVTLTADTLVSNSAPLGGGIFNSGSALTIAGTILDGSPCGGSGASDAGYNLEHQSGSLLSTCGFVDGAHGDSVGRDPRLGPLQDNGGPTATFLPGVASPAADAIPSGAALCPAMGLTDQRGAPRPDDGEDTCDIGAVEAGAPATYTVTSPTDDPTDPGYVHSLRAVLGRVNADGATGDTITFTPVLGPIGLTNGELDLTKTVTIAGPANGAQVIDGSNKDRVFEISAARTTLPITLTSLTVQRGNANGSNTSADSGHGGGIVVDRGAALILTSSTIARNTANEGGGVDNSGALTMTASTIISNTSAYGGGLSTSGMLALNASNLLDNIALDAGGGAYVGPTGILTLTADSVAGNTASSGDATMTDGGGVSTDGGTITVFSSTFRSNAASYGGGAFSNGGRLTLTDTTLVSNTAASDGGAAVNSGSLTLTNSTLGGNAAFGRGGAISTTGSLAVGFTTIAGNQAGTGGGIASSLIAPTLTTSILASNAATSDPDCHGSIASGGYTLLGDATGCTVVAGRGDISGTATRPVDPVLAPLTDNGGPTYTRAPRPNSPAVDAIPSGSAPCLSISTTGDQRGVPRPQGPGCDIGAVEIVSPTIVTDSPVAAGQDAVITVTGVTTASAAGAPQALFFAFNCTGGSAYGLAGASTSGTCPRQTAPGQAPVSAAVELADGHVVATGATTVTVVPGPAASFTVFGYPNTTVAGQTHALTVTAYDGSGNVATGYNGAVMLSGSDAQASYGAPATLANGIGVFTTTLLTAGPQAITATDTVSPAISGTQPAIAVAPATASRLLLNGYPTQTLSGQTHTMTVTLFDAYDNVATGYTGTIHLTSSDPDAALAPDYTFTSTDAGTHALTATLETVGMQSITATDTISPALADAETGITVGLNAAQQTATAATATAQAQQSSTEQAQQLSTAAAATATAQAQQTATATAQAQQTATAGTDETAIAAQTQTAVVENATLTAAASPTAAAASPTAATSQPPTSVAGNLTAVASETAEAGQTATRTNTPLSILTAPAQTTDTASPTVPATTRTSPTVLPITTATSMPIMATTTRTPILNAAINTTTPTPTSTATSTPTTVSTATGTPTTILPSSTASPQAATTNAPATSHASTTIATATNTAVPSTGTNTAIPLMTTSTAAIATATVSTQRRSPSATPNPSVIATITPMRAPRPHPTAAVVPPDGPCSVPVLFLYGSRFAFAGLSFYTRPTISVNELVSTAEHTLHVTSPRPLMFDDGHVAFYSDTRYQSLSCAKGLTMDVTGRVFIGTMTGHHRPVDLAGRTFRLRVSATTRGADVYLEVYGAHIVRTYSGLQGAVKARHIAVRGRAKGH